MVLMLATRTIVSVGIECVDFGKLLQLGCIWTGMISLNQLEQKEWVSE